VRQHRRLLTITDLIDLIATILMHVEALALYI
jgi:hypothetical protein